MITWLFTYRVVLKRDYTVEDWINLLLNNGSFSHLCHNACLLSYSIANSFKMIYRLIKDRLLVFSAYKFIILWKLILKFTALKLRFNPQYLGIILFLSKTHSTCLQWNRRSFITENVIATNGIKNLWVSSFVTNQSSIEVIHIS